MSINSVTLVGRLTRDPELRTTTTGKSVVNFSIAVDDRYNKDDTSFFNIVAWGKTAENVATYMTKGRMVGVEGRLKQRTYKASAGHTVNVVEVIANNAQFLDSKKKVDETEEAQADVEIAGISD